MSQSEDIELVFNLSISPYGVLVLNYANKETQEWVEASESREWRLRHATSTSCSPLPYSQRVLVTLGDAFRLSIGEVLCRRVRVDVLSDVSHDV